MSASAAVVLCLASAVYHEARGEPELGQVAVAYAALTRVEQGYGRDACEVVHARGQFSWTADPRPIREQSAWRRAERVAEDVYARRVPNPAPGATHFHDPSVKPKWKGFSLVRRIGDLLFYKKR